MNKYLLMLSAAALIAAAPVYYAVTAQAGDIAGAPAPSDTPVEISVDCTKVTLDGEELPAECKPTEETGAAQTAQ